MEDIKKELHKINEIFSVFSQHATIKRLGIAYPSFGVESLKNKIVASERMRKHIVNLYDHAFEIKNTRGLSEKDWVHTVIAIVFHDIAKILFDEFDSLSWQEKKVLGPLASHSISAMRIFLSVDDFVLAHAIRHSSSDFVYDIATSNVTIPQLMLNLVDKSYTFQGRVSIPEKYEYIKNKIGMNIGYNDESEELACYYLDNILLDSKKFSEYGFVTKGDPKAHKIAFVQRFDGKYCVPIGKYEDTNSNVKISKIVARWGFSNLILNEGQGIHMYNKGLHFIGLPSSKVKNLIPLHCFNSEIIIVEGSTIRVAELKRLYGKSKKIVLLLRTLSSGSVEQYRLQNMESADDIWVLTEEMKKLLAENFIGANLAIPPIKVLSNGFDPHFFYSDDSKRIKGKIVYVGALAKVKGVDVLIDAFKKLRKEFPYSELHLIGDDKIYGNENNFEKSLYENIEGVIVHGVLREPEIAKHLRSAHFACLLTKIFETFGKSAMQARVCGTRMIVSDKGALPFHVQNENEGIVLSDITKDDVYHAMKKLITEPPASFLPPEDRYNHWLHTALDFYSFIVLLTRQLVFS